MRTLSSVSAVTAAAAACLLLAPAAYATSPVTGGKGKNGDNGTVKIHDAVTDEEYEKRNNPKVCEFYLDAFGFDAGQKVTWEIFQHPQSPEEPALDDTITLDGDGHGRTEDLRLPDGMYKLYWTFEGKKGAPKHKVFKVECEDSGSAGGTATGDTTQGATGETATGDTTQGAAEGSTGEAATGENTTGENATGHTSTGGDTTDGTTATSGETASGDTTDGAAASGEAPGGDSGKAPNGGGNLAETGSGAPVAALAAAAAALLGAGSYLVVRRRTARD